MPLKVHTSFQNYISRFLTSTKHSRVKHQPQNYETQFVCLQLNSHSEDEHIQSSKNIAEAHRTPFITAYSRQCSPWACRHTYNTFQKRKKVHNQLHSRLTLYTIK